MTDYRQRNASVGVLPHIPAVVTMAMTNNNNTLFRSVTTRIQCSTGHEIPIKMHYTFIVDNEMKKLLIIISLYFGKEKQLSLLY